MKNIKEVVKRMLSDAAALQDGRKMNAGLGEEKLHQLLDEVHLELPPEYKELLQEVNGAYLGAGGIYGLCAENQFLDLNDKFRLYPRWKQKNWFPVGSDGCGNFYVVVADGRSRGNNPVGFVDVALDPDRLDYLVASDLWHFLFFYLDDEHLPDDGLSKWPFDRKYVLSRDPRLAECNEAPLPWNIDE